MFRSFVLAAILLVSSSSVFGAPHIPRQEAASAATSTDTTSTATTSTATTDTAAATASDPAASDPAASGAPAGKNGRSPSINDLAKPVLAPYFVSWGNPEAPALADAYTKNKLESATLAFGISPKGTCKLTEDLTALAPQAKAFVAAGGTLVLSFGGRIVKTDAEPVQMACADENELAKLLKTTMDDFGTPNLDFDIEDTEGKITSHMESLTRLGKALEIVRKEDKDLYVSLTLAATKTGLLEKELGIVKAVQAETEVNVVNLMTMDMAADTKVLEDSKTSLEGAAKQVAEILKVDAEKAFSRLGVTPMIGEDDMHNLLTIDEAVKLSTYSKEKKVGLVSYWSFNRDFPGAMGEKSSGFTEQKEGLEFYTAMKKEIGEQKEGKDTEKDSDSASSTSSGAAGAATESSTESATSTSSDAAASETAHVPPAPRWLRQGLN